MLMSYLVYRLGLGSLPHGVSWKALAGVACLAGIGFTMSIFIDNLAYDNPVYVSSGKIAILAASTLAPWSAWWACSWPAAYPYGGSGAGQRLCR